MTTKPKFMTVDDLSYPNVRIDDSRAKRLSKEKTAEGRYHDVMDQTYEEARDEGLHHKIERNGVMTPITLTQKKDHTLLLDGHHRLSVAQRHLHPDSLIPVEWV